MKRILFLCSVWVCLSNIQAQDILPYNHSRPEPMKMPRILKISPGNMLIGPIPALTAAYGIIYETPVARRQSIQVGCSFIGKGLFFRLKESASSSPPFGTTYYETGMMFQFAYKFYLSRKRHTAPRGFYVAPLFRSTTASGGTSYGYRIQGNYITFEQFDANLIYGSQMIRKSGRGLVIDWYVGAGYKHLVATKHYSPSYSTPYSLEGNPFLKMPVNFILGLNIGWAFCPKNKD